MVRMACIDCGQAHFEADTLREMLTLMMPHYFDAHQDIMSGQADEDRDAWMGRFTSAFNACLEDD